MDLSALELQIFVSLTVILGAAFVALVCDYLKGHNEQLREQNIELRARRDEQERMLLMDPVRWLEQFGEQRTQFTPGFAAAFQAHPAAPEASHEPMEAAGRWSSSLPALAAPEAQPADFDTVEPRDDTAAAFISRTFSSETAIEVEPSPGGAGEPERFGGAWPLRERPVLSLEQIEDALRSTPPPPQRTSWLEPGLDVRAELKRMMRRTHDVVPSEVDGAAVPSDIAAPIPLPAEVATETIASVTAPETVAENNGQPVPTGDLSTQSIGQLDFSVGRTPVEIPAEPPQPSVEPVAEVLPSELLSAPIPMPDRAPVTVTEPERAESAPAVAEPGATPPGSGQVIDFSAWLLQTMQEDLPSVSSGGSERPAIDRNEPPAATADLPAAPIEDYASIDSPLHDLSSALDRAEPAERPAPPEPFLEPQSESFIPGIDRPAVTLVTEPIPEPPPQAVAETVAEPTQTVETKSAEEIDAPPAPLAEVAPQPEAPPAAEAIAPPGLVIPAGMHDRATLSTLLNNPGPFSGVVFTIGVTDYKRVLEVQGRGAVDELVAGVSRMISELLQESDFGARAADDSFVIVYPGESGAAAQRRINQVSERLWDFQLRSLGVSSILFSWGAVEAQDETLATAIAAANDRMEQSRRNRKTASFDPSRKL